MIEMTKTLSPDLWKRGHGAKLRTVEPNACLLYLYLLTSSHTSLSGLSYLPIGVIEAETVLVYSEIVRAQHALLKEGLAEFDQVDHVWWVPQAIPLHFVKFNKRDNRWKQAQAQADELKHSRLYEQYVKHRRTLGV